MQISDSNTRCNVRRPSGVEWEDETFLAVVREFGEIEVIDDLDEDTVVVFSTVRR